MNSISFLHSGDAVMASYRYRCSIPARELKAEINDLNAEILIFTKPAPYDVEFASKARKNGKSVIVDFCDPHFSRPEYQELLALAHVVTCPTKWFSDYLMTDFGVDAVVVPDPYELDEAEPHCDGDNLLWFGHGSNIGSLGRIIREIEHHPIRVVSNVEHCIPYTRESILAAMQISDIVVMPETAPYKSCNRTVEAIRRGCFVCAEPHPAINDFPGIWLGNIKDGIEWAITNRKEANERTAAAQMYIRQWFAPAIQADAWRTAIQKAQSSSTSGQVESTGLDGLMSILKTEEPTICAT